MAKCPKCGLDFSVALKKCPNCQTLISPKKKEIDIELPKLKKQEIEVLDEAMIEEKKEIKIKQIPVKVKKAKNHKVIPKKDKTKRKNSNIDIWKDLKIESTIKMVVVVVLFILNIYLIFDIVIQVDRTQPSRFEEVTDDTQKQIVDTTSVMGEWITQNYGKFVFRDDLKFYWYDNYKVLTDNFYSGTYSYKNGEEALEEIGKTQEQINKELEEDIDINKIYSLKLVPLLAYMDGEDKTLSSLNDGEEWWFIVVIKNDSTAVAINHTLDLKYILEKSE